MVRRKKKKKIQKAGGITASGIRRIRRDYKQLQRDKKRNARARAKRERDFARGEKELSKAIRSHLMPKSKGRRSSAKLTQLPQEFIFNGYSNYTPQSIRSAFGGSPEEQMASMRAEYSRLRAVAQKRLARLGKSDYSGSEVYKYYNDQFKKLKDISDNKLPEALVSVNRFLQNPLSTIRGQTDLRNERISTLRSYGYDVNVKNFEKVVEVMDKVRAMINDKFYDSDQVLQDTVDVINEMLADPDTDWESRSSYDIANEVYDRYANNSSELLSLSIK